MVLVMRMSSYFNCWETLQMLVPTRVVYIFPWTIATRKLWRNCKDGWMVNSFHNTNAGLKLSRKIDAIESQNKLLKYSYLPHSPEKSLTTIITMLEETFFPDQHRKYPRINVRTSGDFQSHRENILHYLHGWPPSLIKHCLKWITSAEDTHANEITCIGQMKFSVQSQTN